MISPLLDPVAMVASPLAGDVLVLSGYGDALVHLEQTGEVDSPYRSNGEVPAMGAAPALPTSVDVLRRGGLSGLVLVTENQGIRRLRFSDSGGVADEGIVWSGSGFEAIVGAIGIQP